MTDIRLTPQARHDLEDIRRFTVETWGPDQWHRYFTGLLAAIERVTVERNCGRPRHSLRPKMRSLGYLQHLIFFEPIAHAGGETVILRIVHQRRDLSALTYFDDMNG